MELGLVWMMFLPRRWRIVLFFIVTPWQIVVILTANYTFLNYLVLCLGILLLDDRFIAHFTCCSSPGRLSARPQPRARVDGIRLERGSPLGGSFKAVKLAASLPFTWIFYATTVPLLWMFTTAIPLPVTPISALEPFRIANRYGLFAVMTRGRYEIEFQGSQDGQNWTPYPFRYKPQDVKTPPGIYAPYQPRFDWNLWFASLGSWREYPIVANTEVRLLSNDKDVLGSFCRQSLPAANLRNRFEPCCGSIGSPRWRKSVRPEIGGGVELLGLYAPVLEREPDGTIVAIEMPEEVERNVR